MTGKTPPKIIYLQYFVTDPVSHEVTWNIDQINDNDAKYVLVKDAPKFIRNRSHATLAGQILDRPVRREDWHTLAFNWGLRSDYTLRELAPDGISCKACWDFRTCAECLGEYPDTCPDDCIDGTCPECRVTTSEKADE